MDLEAESTVKVDTAMTEDIATSCNKLIETQNEIAKAEEQLKKLKETEREYSEQTIPNLMQQAGVRTLKLTDGTSIEIKPFYSAKIPHPNKRRLLHGFVTMDMAILLKIMLLYSLAKHRMKKQLVL